MIKISILYSNTGKFDMGYYLDKHMPHAAELQGDMPNYTDIEAIIQVSEVAISR